MKSFCMCLVDTEGQLTFKVGKAAERDRLSHVEIVAH